MALRLNFVQADTVPGSDEMPSQVQEILECKASAAETAAEAQGDEGEEAPFGEKTEPYERRWWRAAAPDLRIRWLKLKAGTDGTEGAVGPIAQAVANKTPRRCMWEAATEIFHINRLRDLAKGTVDMPPLLANLKCLFDFWSPLLFMVRPHDVQSYKKPPPELFEHVTFEEFRQQFAQFRDVLPQVLQQVEVAKGKHFKEADVFAAFMVQPYAWTKRHGIWHFLRMWMRLWVAGGSTEALSEMIASFMTAQVQIEKFCAVANEWQPSPSQCGGDTTEPRKRSPFGLWGGIPQGPWCRAHSRGPMRHVNRLFVQIVYMRL